MKTVLLFVFLCFLSQARAEDANIWLQNIESYVTGTQSAGHNSVDVNISGGSLPIVIPSNSPLPVVFASPSPTLSVSVLNFPATQSVSGTVTAVVASPLPVILPSPLPSGSNLIGSVQDLDAINANATLSDRQSVNGTESNLQAPGGAVGVLLECESGNQDNLRWGFSNGASNILSTTLGVVCEPGRDSGYFPVGAGTYLHMIAVTTASSDYVDVQWVLQK